MRTAYITRGNTHVFWHADLTCSHVPRKKRTRAAVEKEKEKDVVGNSLEVPKEVKKVDSGYLGKDVLEKKEPHNKPSSGKKSSTLEPTIKAPKTEKSKDMQVKASPVQVIKFLLSDAALEICRPVDEIEDIRERGSEIITYSQLLSPFEELLCAVILSRPISHPLGMRTIRTILNPPYEFRNPVAIKTAGVQKVKKALWDARTQHEDKTAEEIELLADAVSNNNWHNDLEKMRKQAKGSVETEREILRRSIKGLGKTGLDIFYRRIQWLWEEAYPFIDSRTQASLEKLGLPKRAEGIAKMIEVRWDGLKIVDDEGYTEEEMRRRAFVILLERAVGADLEKRIDEILQEAAKL